MTALVKKIHNYEAGDKVHAYDSEELGENEWVGKAWDIGFSIGIYCSMPGLAGLALGIGNTLWGEHVRYASAMGEFQQAQTQAEATNAVLDIVKEGAHIISGAGCDILDALSIPKNSTGPGYSPSRLGAPPVH